jgi:hypothetical protein
MVLSHRGRLTVNPSGGLRGAATSEPKRRWAECVYHSRWWANTISNMLYI